MLTQKRLKELLSYDPATGVFIWIKPVSRNTYIGKVAGCNVIKGYIKIAIDSKIYFAHRLVWLYMYGKFPSQYIDHINRKRSDNRISNLRDVSLQENQKNRTLTINSKTTKNGVHIVKGGYRVTIGGNKNRIHGGYHKLLKDAIKERELLESKLNYKHV